MGGLLSVAIGIVTNYTFAKQHIEGKSYLFYIYLQICFVRKLSSLFGTSARLIPIGINLAPIHLTLVNK